MVSFGKEKSDSVKERITIRKKGQVTIPKPILDQFDLKEGDSLNIVVNESGEIYLVPLIQVPANQKWFWTDKWQQEEAEAEEDIRQGRVKSFTSVEDLFSELDKDEV